MFEEMSLIHSKADIFTDSQESNRSIVGSYFSKNSFMEIPTISKPYHNMLAGGRGRAIGNIRLQPT